MSALLKIVQGPNAGAEIALPDGVEITVGAADACDIVLADPTLPEAPLRLTAAPDGTVSAVIPPADAPTTLETAHVFFYGSSALAVGPAASPWPPLVFPAPEAPASPEPAPTPSPAPAATPTPPPPTNPKNPKDPKNPTPKKSRSRLPRFLLWLLALLLLLLLLLGLLLTCARPSQSPSQESQESQESQALSAYVDRYALTLDDTGSRPVLTGNFATRAERLAATADLYSAFPGVSLDLTDDESLRTAVSDALFTLGETGLSVADVSNRVATLSGTASSPDALSAALDALRADVPRLTDVVTSDISFQASASTATPAPALSRSTRAKRSATPSLPVCGILTTPYPCLVLQNGVRVFPGATLGGYVVSSISADSVVLTNSTNSLTWKP